MVHWGKEGKHHGNVHVQGEATHEEELLGLDPNRHIEVIGGSSTVHDQGEKSRFDLSRMRTAGMSN